MTIQALPYSTDHAPGMYNPAKPRKMSTDGEITQLLVAWKDGDEGARDRLIPVLYQELRRMAARYLRNERSAGTLQPTMLVHEAYMRLVQQKLPDWESRAHFFGVAAHLMRQLLVERARRHNTQKRGEGINRVPLDEAMDYGIESSDTIVNLDAAMDALAKQDERKCKVIELRYFGGLTIDEAAETLGISAATVVREQRLAEAWLYREMRGESR